MTVIEMLNQDLMDEIEAILTYLRNSYMEGACLPSRAAEEIALDEMRHVEWLSEMIVDLGGEPRMEHHSLNFGGRDTVSQLKRMVEQENGAIAQYRDHIDKITDEKIRRKLNHILEEEIGHAAKFSRLLAEAEQTQN